MYRSTQLLTFDKLVYPFPRLLWPMLFGASEVGDKVANIEGSLLFIFAYKIL